MNRQFEQFLARKDKEIRDYNTCNHDKDHWCQNCFGGGGVAVRDQFGGRGMIMSNSPAITEAIIENCNLTKE